MPWPLQPTAGPSHHRLLQTAVDRRATAKAALNEFDRLKKQAALLQRRLLEYQRKSALHQVVHIIGEDFVARQRMLNVCGIPMWLSEISDVY
jgi:hypothetical protein